MDHIIRQLITGFAVRDSNLYSVLESLRQRGGSSRSLRNNIIGKSGKVKMLMRSNSKTIKCPTSFLCFHHHILGLFQQEYFVSLVIW